MSNFKDLKISNTLLSEILKRPVEIIDIDEYKCMIRNSTYFDNKQRGIVYRYLYGNKEIRFMTIYELAFKCKEWALKKGYIIQSELEGYTFENIAYSICRVYFDGDKVYDNYEINNICYQDEKIAIIEACEWVLREVNK